MPTISIANDEVRLRSYRYVRPKRLVKASFVPVDNTYRSVSTGPHVQYVLYREKIVPDSVYEYLEALYQSADSKNKLVNEEEVGAALEAEIKELAGDSQCAKFCNADKMIYCYCSVDSCIEEAIAKRPNIAGRVIAEAIRDFKAPEGMELCSPAENRELEELSITQRRENPHWGEKESARDSLKKVSLAEDVIWYFGVRVKKQLMGNHHAGVRSAAKRKAKGDEAIAPAHVQCSYFYCLASDACRRKHVSIKLELFRPNFTGEISPLKSILTPVLMHLQNEHSSQMMQLSAPI